VEPLARILGGKGLSIYFGSQETKLLSSRCIAWLPSASYNIACRAILRAPLPNKQLGVDTTHGAAFALVAIRVCVGRLFGSWVVVWVLGGCQLPVSWVVVYGLGWCLCLGRLSVCWVSVCVLDGCLCLGRLSVSWVVVCVLGGCLS
jgi:hypothetical protein